MTRNEFQSLKVGDRIGYSGNVQTVASIQTEYDYSVKPARVVTWAVETTTGGYVKIDDRMVAQLTIK